VTALNHYFQTVLFQQHTIINYKILRLTKGLMSQQTLMVNWFFGSFHQNNIGRFRQKRKKYDSRFRQINFGNHWFYVLSNIEYIL